MASCILSAVHLLCGTGDSRAFLPRPYRTVSRVLAALSLLSVILGLSQVHGLPKLVKFNACLPTVFAASRLFLLSENRNLPSKPRKQSPSFPLIQKQQSAGPINRSALCFSVLCLRPLPDAVKITNVKCFVLQPRTESSGFLKT